MIFSFDLKNMSSKCPHMCLLADPSGGIASALFCRCIPEFGSRQSSAPPRCEATAGALRAPPIPPPFPYPLPPFPNIPLGLTSGRMPAFHDVVKLFTVALAVASPVCIPAIWLQPPNHAPPHPTPCRVPLPPLPPFCDDSDHYIHLICAQRHAFIPMPRLPAARAPPSPSRRRHHAPAPTRFDRTSQ